ncbi:hypothetical protein J2T12_002253 [Paenibacillus anaericanus]|uniref:hypothetical protein n=1 Tax=Paenibacillus anaericanus TaxID=170367 RepID=UPI00278387D8|nr:hypothetical protein [Paenibacillus anaericanus]MDQ0088843.1 hypothetical protein [Paenibacillus anaericanus]
MDEQEVSYITYTQKHKDIIHAGVTAINEIFNSKDVSEKRSLLFCLDKYLDPYYGYNLVYFDEVFLILEKQLFISNTKEVKEDILQLLTDYSKKNLDYLAENIEEIDSEILADALYALGNTYNKQYVPVFITFENHEDTTVSNTAKNALIELSKI